MGMRGLGILNKSLAVVCPKTLFERGSIMAVISQNKNLTLAEINKISGNADAAAILADLAQRNDFIDEVPWFPSTHGSHNEQFKAKSLGRGAFRAGNDAIPILSSAGDIYKEPVRVYEGDSVVDDLILKAANDPYNARDAQDIMNLEGILQDFNHALIYANPLQDKEAFVSFSQRRKKLGAYCRGAGGTGTDLTSFWLFEFGKRGVYMVYNKSGSPGLKNEDMGLKNVPVLNTDNTVKGYMWGWIRHYEIWAGIVVANDRALQRYCNIETDPGSSNFDPNTVIDMTAQLPTPGGNMAVGFAPRSIFAEIQKHAYNKVNASYSLEKIEGFGPVPKIVNVYVRPWEAISEGESAVA